MLSFEQLKPSLYKWGKYYQNSDFEFWELVNSAWIDPRLRRVENIKIASIATRRAMINYMREITKNNLKARFIKRGGIPAKIYNFTSLSKKPFLIDKTRILPDISYDSVDYFRWLMSDLDERNRRIFLGVYLDGLTLADLGRQFGITIQAVSARHKIILESIKAKLKNGKNNSCGAADSCQFQAISASKIQEAKKRKGRRILAEHKSSA